MNGEGAADLLAILEEAATDLEEVERLQAPDGTGVEWAIGGRVFAAADGGRAEFRLSSPVASAALRTPDTAPSSRGSDWVAFAPQELDRHATDRATAWLASAWRRADGES
jgi:hypothetical protein